MTDYITNSVKLLPKIDNYLGYIKIYTVINSNFIVGDKIFITSYNSGSTNSNLDNYIYYINDNVEYFLCGYEILYTDINNNYLVINRLYSTIIDSTILETDFYISKIYIRYCDISGVTNMNSVVILDTIINISNISIAKWKQGIILNGNITNIDLLDKYDNDILSTKSIIYNNDINTKYTFNNDGFGYSIFNNLNIVNCDIENGTFNNCIISSSGTTIFNCTNGYYDSCIINNICNIYGGYYYKTSITNINTNWYDGTFDPVNYNILFKPKIWYDGIWQSYNVPNTLDWFNGVFNGIQFNGLSWHNGTFNGEFFNGNYWYNGNFNSGKFISFAWVNGVFNNGTFGSDNKLSVWDNGVFNNGVFNGVWNNGIFNNGDYIGSDWFNGIWNNGNFTSGHWINGDFYNGNLKNITWDNGNFYNGVITNVTWNSGNFYNGNIFNSLWNSGNFYNGNIYSTIWNKGNFYNGIVYNSRFIQVEWFNGIVNDSNIGYNDTNDIIMWHTGSFNSGTINRYVIWKNGIFYDGVFEGTWENGIFYIGEYNNAIMPPANPRNSKYIPYNKIADIRQLFFSNKNNII